jgi:hypothetical protein
MVISSVEPKSTNAEIEPKEPSKNPSPVRPRWGAWSYLPAVAVSLDDEEPEMAELVRRGGRKVG